MRNPSKRKSNTITLDVGREQLLGQTICGIVATTPTITQEDARKELTLDLRERASPGKSWNTSGE
jgi:hypothetical protein